MTKVYTSFAEAGIVGLKQSRSYEYVKCPQCQADRLWAEVDAIRKRKSLASVCTHEDCTEDEYMNAGKDE